MSAELLINKPYFIHQQLRNKHKKGASQEQSQKPKEQIKHSAVHDLESFFWVLVWLCVTRGGPATRRACLDREASDNSNAGPERDKESVRNPDLDRFLASTFENNSAGTLAEIKRGAFREILLADEEATNMWLYELDDLLISDFFRPLQDLIRSYYRVLQTAYHNRDHRDLHSKVIKCFEDAQADVSISAENLLDEPRLKEQYERELKRRMNDLQREDDANVYGDAAVRDSLQGMGIWESPGHQRMRPSDAISTDATQLREPVASNAQAQALPSESVSPSPQVRPTKRPKHQT